MDSQTTNYIGNKSKGLRFLIAAVFVIIYWGIGRIFNMSTTAYQVLGIPILIIFQHFINRQPLRTLWVRDGAEIKRNIKFYFIFVIFAIVPLYSLIVAIINGKIDDALFAVVAVAGAYPFSYALYQMKAKNWLHLIFCAAIIVVIIMFPYILVNVLHLNFHVGGGKSISSGTHISLSKGLPPALQMFMMMPVGFWVEEVFFRGALDGYIHRNEKNIGVWSAIFISALWGFWHMSNAQMDSHFVSNLINLLIPQIIIGVPLSLFMRKSRNLLVPNTAHGLLDALRTLLANGV